MNRNLRTILMGVAAVVLCCGCQPQRPEGLEKLYPVQLTFTQETKPLEGAIVSLTSVDKSVRYTVGGVTDASGVVLLYTQGQYKGVPAGTYKVRVVKTEETESNSLDGAEFEAWARSNDDAKTESWSLVEKSYTKFETTPLELKVSERVDTQFDLGRPVRDVL
ncbi:MAG: carboxypeptidase-like regulatory domain-containing protein [Planctomycetia bacterium]|nr:carboxypeptidase-like regulatory domain-containing protein [Planctomycetia bacterium]